MKKVPSSLTKHNPTLSKSFIEDWLPKSEKGDFLTFDPRIYTESEYIWRFFELGTNLESFLKSTPPESLIRRPFLTSLKEALADSVKIKIGDSSIEDLPKELEYVGQIIDDSKYILELGNDWDDEGSEGYSKHTWVRSITFLTRFMKWAYLKYNKKVERPKIYHGSNGSIDILWENSKYRLLINIPKDKNNSAQFYGDDYKKESVKGTFDTNNYHKELFWSLMNK